MTSLQSIVRSNRLSGEQLFFLSGILVNAGNYLYNLALGRLLGPEKFAEAAMLVTLLLIFSFLAMTFQIVVAKFSIEFDQNKRTGFLKWAYKRAIIIGVLIGGLLMLLSSQMSVLFNTAHATGYFLFGLTIPIYFAMAVNRGVLQGANNFKALAKTYQGEMISRLLVTFTLLMVLDFDPIMAVSIGILISICIGMLPISTITVKGVTAPKIDAIWAQKIGIFFLLTALYEGIQIACNNSDILLVKHYFPNHEAGLYASLALIGRVVYFVTWMFIMLLLPKIIHLKKQGKPTRKVLAKYTSAVALIAGTITLWCFVFDSFTIQLMFGEQYLVMAPYLGWYALATSLFALANLFVYYYLSLNHYMPVAIAMIFGIVQVVLIVCFHDSFFEVVVSQIVAMGGLLIGILWYHFIKAKQA